MVLNVCSACLHSRNMSSQLIIFLCICVCVCARVRIHMQRGMTGNQLLRLVAHVGRIKNPEDTYTHLRVRQAKIEMSESKKSDVCHLLITGCQKSFK